MSIAKQCFISSYSCMSKIYRGINNSGASSIFLVGITTLVVEYDEAAFPDLSPAVC